MKYALKAQSLVILRSILSVPGWAKTIEDSYRGGKMLVELPEPKEQPIDKKISFELDDHARDLVKLATNNALAKDVLPVSPYLVDIFEVLNFVPSAKSEKPSE